MKLIELYEGTWALPDTDKKVLLLRDLLSNPIRLTDTEKMDALYGIVGDDEFLDAMESPADESDIRPELISVLPRILDTSDWKRKPDEHVQFLIDLLKKKHKL
jgi:hypothetical protein